MLHLVTKSRTADALQAEQRGIGSLHAGRLMPRSLDRHVRMLTDLFRRHPAWLRAADYVADGAESAVSFSHLPGRRWRLIRRSHQTLLLPGRAHDPDFEFRFTPAAVERLAEVDGDVGDFAVELFARILEPREERRVDFRVIASFSRLARRGYVRLLLAAGPKVLRFGATRGVVTLRDLRALVAAYRAGGRAM
jgi:hypothetical protein